jgi:hypothetical protein
MPYAPPATVLQVIHHFQNREVPETVTDTVLGQIGVKPSILLQVKQALVFLNLLREDGTTTDNFKALRFANDEERPKLFGDLVMGAYSEIVSITDPATATRSQLFNAFRPYSPASQHDRMITLFLALCQEAGIKIAQAPRQYSTQSSPRAISPARKLGRGPSRQADTSGQSEEILRHPPTPSGLLFGVTEADINALTAGEFDEVWAALGKVARARAKAREKPNVEPTPIPASGEA